MVLSDRQWKTLQEFVTEGRHRGMHERTIEALSKRGLIEFHWNTWRLTALGQAVASAPREEPRAPGRPRRHTDRAQKQWTYRQKRDGQLRELQRWMGRAKATGGQAAILADRCDATTGWGVVEKLIEYLKREVEGSEKPFLAL